jgi:hypothetical protein
MSVEITSPVNGDVFTVGKEVTFAGTASDGIVRVGLLAEGQRPLPGLCNETRNLLSQLPSNPD